MVRTQFNWANHTEHIILLFFYVLQLPTHTFGFLILTHRSSRLHVFCHLLLTAFCVNDSSQCEYFSCTPTVYIKTIHTRIHLLDRIFPFHPRVCSHLQFGFLGGSGLLSIHTAIVKTKHKVAKQKSSFYEVYFETECPKQCCVLLNQVIVCVYMICFFCLFFISAQFVRSL